MEGQKGQEYKEKNVSSYWVTLRIREATGT